MGKPLPGISSEIAEHDAVRLLGLEPKASQDAGWDAVDPATGRRRSRVAPSSTRPRAASASASSRSISSGTRSSWCWMDEDYEPYEIYEALREDLEDFVDSSSSGRSKRGAMSVARFKIVGELVGPGQRPLRRSLGTIRPVESR